MRDVELCSMDYWFPLIQGLNIKQPKTMCLNTKNKVSFEEWYNWCEGTQSAKIIKVIEELEKLIKNNFNYPVFLRTDQFSGKHDWKRTCFIQNQNEVGEHLWNLVEANMMAGMFGELPINSLYVREYVEMDNLFTAFYGELPINPEIRLFVRDGVLEEKFWYWIEDAIKNPSIENFNDILNLKEKESMAELDDGFLNSLAFCIGQNLPGYWSVDLCRAKDGQWYLIDMALGELSWHPIKRNH